MLQVHVETTKATCWVPTKSQGWISGLTGGNRMLSMAGVSLECAEDWALSGVPFSQGPAHRLGFCWDPHTAQFHLSGSGSIPHNDISCHLLSVYHILVPLLAFSKLILQRCRGGGSYCPHFTDEKTLPQATALSRLHCRQVLERRPKPSLSVGFKNQTK